MLLFFLYYPELDVVFVIYLYCLLPLQMEIEMFTQSPDSPATGFSNALVVKSHLKQVHQIRMFALFFHMEILVS